MISRQLLRFGALAQFSHQPIRRSSILNSLNSSPVLVSSNTDIYTNLALEHWLYSNLKFGCHEEKEQDRISFIHPIVLIWLNEPCLVIGRHQNPWIETTTGLAQKLGIKLARRHSGGGCVYHDESNINISIIGERKLFENRQDNLRLLAGFLNKKYGVKCEPNKRHDLVHSETGLKMSGSAAKLGRFNSYHHFTLLVNTDKEIMKAAIRQDQQDYIHTNSSLSNRSGVINLNEMELNLTAEQVMADLAQEYSCHYKDSSMKHSARKAKVEGDTDDMKSISKIRSELCSWEWIFGMTPKFRLERCIDLVHRGKKLQAVLRVHIEKGSFKKFEIESNQAEIDVLANRFDHLIGTRFDYKDAMVNVVRSIDVSAAIGYEQLFATHLLQMIHGANF